MTEIDRAWRRRNDVAWIGDHTRVIAARTSPPDEDGPRILEGAAAALWLRLAVPRTQSELVAEAGQSDPVERALTALSEAGLIEPG